MKYNQKSQPEIPFYLYLFWLKLNDTIMNF